MEDIGLLLLVLDLGETEFDFINDIVRAVRFPKHDTYKANYS